MTGFWFFMLIMCLLTPAMMIGFGKYFMKGGPKQINWGVWISDEKIHEKSGDLDVCASVQWENLAPQWISTASYIAGDNAVLFRKEC